MQLTFLKAGNGDSILIQHQGKNIIIDGGNDSRYLLDQISRFKDGEIIDLLVITHHDDDHIKGIIELLQRVDNGDYGDKTKFIKRVIFNSPRFALGRILPEKDRTLSYKQAHEVEELLLSINPDWSLYDENSPDIDIEGLKLEILSPSKDDIKEYSENTGAYLSSDYKCDWETSMHVLEKYLDDKSQDNSLFNRSSVVFIIECEGKKVLLTGDVTPGRMEKIISRLVKLNNDAPVEFDYIKLPHHASYRSLNRKILESIKCKNFVVSTNSKKYFLPNKRALLKVLTYSRKDRSEKVNFIFNYREAITNLNISDKEMKDYNFSLIPNNEDHGFVIR